jgi:tRNA pseudouridine38-40 synthase
LSDCHPSADPRFKLTVAFDGTAFHGWHAGRSGKGISDHIEKALADLFPSAPQLVGSSRTDSGVHALGLVAHFDVPASEARIPARRLAAALNSRLPREIRILTAARTCHAFHARFGATSKQYRYQLWNAPVINPLLQHQAWHVPQDLALSIMCEAAAHLTGRHDFRAFTSKRDGMLTDSIRTLTRCEIQAEGPLLTFILQGDGFLYKMCRAIVGTLVRCGRGMMTSEDVKNLLEGKTGRTRGMNAPAHGLILWKVSYEPRQGSKHFVAGLLARAAGSGAAEAGERDARPKDPAAVDPARQRAAEVTGMADLEP